MKKIKITISRSDKKQKKYNSQAKKEDKFRYQSFLFLLFESFV